MYDDPYADWKSTYALEKAEAAQRQNQSLIERVEAIEARMRDRKWHDPDCPVRQDQKANEYGGAYYHGGVCNCWLSA